MPQPAPARFAAADRRALRISLATALGPTATFAVLIAGYALSTRECQPGIRPLIAGCIAAAGLSCAGAIHTLLRTTRSPEEQPQATRGLASAALALQVFCLCVLAGFGIALAAMVRCD